MAVPSAFVLNLLIDIAKEDVNKDLGITISQSVKGTVKVGAATLLSSLLLGPAGFVLGSVVGGGWAYATSSDFKPLVNVIYEMTDTERENMVAVARNVAQERGIELALSSLLPSSPQARSFLVEVFTRLGLGSIKA